MKQDNIIITGPDAQGFYRLEPEEGYMLMKKDSPERLYSEAVTKTPQDFESVKIENDKK